MQRPAPTTESTCTIVLRAPKTAPFAQRFTVRVERNWPSTHVAESFRDEALAPLRVEARDRTRELERGRLRETLRFDAWLARSGEFEIAPIELRAAPINGGQVLVARSRAAVIRVDPLDVEGAPELPLDVMPRAWRFPWRNALFGTAGLGALAIAGLVVRRRRIAAQLARAADPVLRDREALTAMTRALEQSSGDAREATRALARIARNALARQSSGAARTTPTRPLLAELRSSGKLGDDELARLTRILELCDAVKFSGKRTRKDELLAAARELCDVFDALEARRPQVATH